MLKSKLTLSLYHALLVRKRSDAIHWAGVYPSEMTTISDGPAIISIPTVPKTCFFAEATYALPGPTILSTL